MSDVRKKTVIIRGWTTNTRLTQVPMKSAPYESAKEGTWIEGHVELVSIDSRLGL